MQKKQTSIKEKNYFMWMFLEYNFEKIIAILEINTLKFF